MQGLNVQNKVIGVLCLLLGLLAIFLWIPLDTETGITEVTRRHVAIGDALAPTVAAVIFAFAGLLLLVLPDRGREPAVLKLANFAYLGRFLVLLAVALAVMRWAGPFLVEALQAAGIEMADYRLLRDTVPWKYTGYVAGGTVMVGGLICFIEHRLSWRFLAIGIAVSILLALIYDLPFDDLLLPPNGDL